VAHASSEVAAHTNSVLRNAGLNVHVVHADRTAEADRLLREFHPFLVVYHESVRETLPLADLGALVADQGVFVALPGGTGSLDSFSAVAEQTPLIVLGEGDGQLTELVRRLAGLGAAQDADASRRAREEELRERLDLALASTDEAIAYFHEGLHVAANPAYLRAMGAPSLDALAGTSLLEIAEAEAVDFRQLLRGFGRGEFPSAPLRCSIRPADGEPFAAELRFDPVRYDDEDCVQVVLRRNDQPERAQDSHPAPAVTKQDQAAPAAPQETTGAPAPMAPREAALRTEGVDPLTGLMARPAFMSWLDHWIEERAEAQRGAVLYLSPDHPEQDLEGRSIAERDEYERALARTVSRFVGKNDAASHFRDNAFILALQREDRSEARAVAIELRDAALALATENPSRLMPKTCSVAYVLVDPHAHDAESAVAQALEAWRQAAAEGSQVQRYKPALNVDLSDDEESLWVSRIRYALLNDEFVTIQYDVTNLEGENEGLVENRTFLHEEDGNVSAEAFLPVAERNDLASNIDRQVIPGLLRAIAGGQERHIVNVSGNSLHDFSFPSWLRRELQSNGIDGRRVVLQWSVSAARDHGKAARRLIEELEPLGCAFSLAGMNGDARDLSVAGKYRPAYLRFDPALTKDLRGHPRQVDSINGVVREAGALGAVTIASDVTNSSDLAVLWQCGVKLVSGDFLQNSPKVIGA